MIENLKAKAQSPLKLNQFPLEPCPVLQGLLCSLQGSWFFSRKRWKGKSYVTWRMCLAATSHWQTNIKPTKTWCTRLSPQYAETEKLISHWNFYG